MSDRREDILESIQQSAQVIGSLVDVVDDVNAVTQIVIEALKSGGKVMTMGHGGSAAEALHMSEELMGRFKAERIALPAVALVADPTLLTCIGNDYGFASLFPRQVEGLGQAGDVLVVFSTSGNGEGLVKSVEVAKSKGVKTIGLLGKGGGAIGGTLDGEVVVGSDETARIQEAHQLVMHVILEAVDAAFV